MKLRVLVLGAGFGGLELSSVLSEQLHDDLELTLIDRNDSFFFGYSKLDVMFGHKKPEAVLIPYAHVVKPGVRFIQDEITEIDPEAKSVQTAHGSFDSDVLVVALGADYDVSATPGLAEGGNEFYSFAGAKRVRENLPSFSKGHAIVGVTSKPFKATGAVSEAALLLNDYLTERGVRDACSVSLIMPFGAPIPPSPEASQALLKAFSERGISFVPNRTVKALDPGRQMVILDDESEMPYDLFLGVPKHRVPEVVAASDLVDKGWIPVNPKTLETRFPDVYAFGDVASIGIPKTGGFAESAARVVAADLIAKLQKGERPGPYSGTSSAYIEFGRGQVGRMNLDFLSGPKPVVDFTNPSEALSVEKEEVELRHRARWFGE
jgi:sulfide:quinone oxidoreductase